MPTKVSSLFTKKKKLMLLVDGPNMLRKEFKVKLETVMKIAEKYGKVVTAKVYLNQYAPPKLVEAVSNSGLTPEITPYDIHIMMALDVIGGIMKKDMNVIVIASRHARCAPIIRKAKEMGAETVSIGFEPGFSIALKNTADYYEMLNIQNDKNQI
ncbi:MAG: NYN domain-containing protein [Candidatus Asgardarchaeia archaeon]